MNHEIRVQPALALDGFAVHCTCGNLTGFAHSPSGAIVIFEDHLREEEWRERKEEGAKVAALLESLPTGSEFDLCGVNRAYTATYRKNANGTWDQVPGTCASAHVSNLDPAHLGFCVGAAAIEEAIR